MRTESEAQRACQGHHLGCEHGVVAGPGDDNHAGIVDDLSLIHIFPDLPVPGGPINNTFSPRRRNSSPASVSTCALFTLGCRAKGKDVYKRQVQEWLGHANIATTRIYDHSKTRPEDSPTFKVAY